jgi:hypothetical protein
MTARQVAAYGDWQAREGAGRQVLTEREVDEGVGVLVLVPVFSLISSLVQPATLS